MDENKTKPTPESVTEFLNKIEDPGKRADCFTLLELIESVTGQKAVMWGGAIVGFGLHHYVYPSGREGDTAMIGFSPRKAAITIYLLSRPEQLAGELARLGKHKTGKGCLYIKSLGDVDALVLKNILEKAYKIAQTRQLQMNAGNQAA
jgi:hypothetical protein